MRRVDGTSLPYIAMEYVAGVHSIILIGRKGYGFGCVKYAVQIADAWLQLMQLASSIATLSLRM